MYTNPSAGSAPPRRTGRQLLGVVRVDDGWLHPGSQQGPGAAANVDELSVLDDMLSVCLRRRRPSVA
jgi:hypothetical protein